jgi:prevent-host-death family protein
MNLEGRMKSMKVRETATVPAGTFKDICLQLMDEVNTGVKEYVITKHGKPVARLVAPYASDAAEQSAFGYLANTVIAADDDLTATDFAAWEAWPEK